ncbi:hypothetical protein JCM3770_002644, partial [Rhodotorula araucariae]
PTQPPLSVKFPLSPGTASVPSTACDKCGLNGHKSFTCSSKRPVPLAERNYRRHWRLIETSTRLTSSGRQGPSWLNNPNKAVNMLADIDNLMGDHDELFFPPQDVIDATIEAASQGNARP